MSIQFIGFCFIYIQKIKKLVKKSFIFVKNNLGPGTEQITFARIEQDRNQKTKDISNFFLFFLPF